MTKKTVEFDINDSGAASKVDKITEQVRRTNDKSVSSLREQIRLLEKKNALEEESENRKISETRKDVNFAQRDLQLWRIERQEQRKTLSGKERYEFDQATQKEESSRRRGIILDRDRLETNTSEANDSKTDRKRQLRTLNEQLDEQRKHRKVSEDFSGNIARMGQAGASGNGLGMIGAMGGAGSIIAGVAAGLFAVASSAESGLRKSSALNRSSAWGTGFMSSAMLGAGIDVQGILGISSKEYAESKGVSQSFAAGRNMMGSAEDAKYSVVLSAIERSRALTEGQVEGLLSVERYSGRKATGSVSTLENYLNATKGSLVQLPELLQTYLATANGILARTGTLNAAGVEQMLTSIGKSYGVEGVNLDRMSKGFEETGKMSQNPVMLSIQQRMLRKLHPNMSAWDMMAIMEDPTKDPEYLKALTEEMRGVGGGGDFAKFFMLNQGKFAKGDIDKIFKNDLALQKANESAASDHIKESTQQTGSTETIWAELKEVKDIFGRFILHPMTVNPELAIWLGKLMTKAFADGIEQKKTTLQGRR